MYEVCPVLPLLVVSYDRVGHVFLFRHSAWRFVHIRFEIIYSQIEVLRHVQPFLLLVIDHLTPRQIDDRLPSIFAWEVSVPVDTI